MEDDLDGLNEQTVNMRTIEDLSVAQKAKQFDILINLIRKKTISDTGKNIQLLTLAPQTCSRNTLANFLGVSGYVVRESRQIFETTSILTYEVSRSTKSFDTNYNAYAVIVLESTSSFSARKINVVQ